MNGMSGGYYFVPDFRFPAGMIGDGYQNPRLFAIGMNPTAQ